MLTETRVSTKRHERIMKRRAKRTQKRTRYGLLAQSRAWRRDNAQSWLLDLGKSQRALENEQAESRRQGLESRRTIQAIPKDRPRGLMGRIKAFFRRGG